MSSNEEHKFIKEKLDARVKEALKLRFEADVLHAGAGQEEILQELIAVRQRLNRLEGIFDEVLLTRADLYSRYNEAQVISRDAWEAQVTKTRKSTSAWGNDYSTGREREAEINLTILTQRRTEASSEKIAIYADERFKLIRNSYYGLDGYRKEILARLQSFRSETAWEQQ